MIVFQPGDRVQLDLPGCPPLTVLRVMPDDVRVCVHWFDSVGGYHENAFHAEQLSLCDEKDPNGAKGK